VEKVVVYWSKAFADREKAKQKSFLAFLDKVRESPENFRITSIQYKNLKPFLKNELENIKTGETIYSKDLKIIIDEDKINSFVSHMGYYQIVSSETNKDPLEIIDIYHGLSQIENQFRLMKGDLNTRPIFIRTHEHIYAHLLICMIALTVVRLIQNKVVDYQDESGINKKTKHWQMGLSGSRVQRALNKWTVDRFPGEYYRFNNLDDDDLKLILEAFDIKIPVKLFRKVELKHIKQTINLSM
jgi:transposase